MASVGVRTGLVVYVVVAAALAGCLGSSPSVTPPAGPIPPVPFPTLPANAEPFALLLCKGDTLVPLKGSHSKDCNVRVTDPNGPAAETSVAVNPKDPMSLVGGAKDFTLGEDGSCGKYNVWSGYYWSRDGGRTWGNGLMAGHPKDARKTPLSAYQCGSDPVVAFGPNGTAYYVGLMYNPGDPPPHPMLSPLFGGHRGAALAVSRSTDGGETWEEAVLAVKREPGQGGLDKEWIAVDPDDGRIYVSYIDFGPGSLRVVRSDDGGRTWSQPVDVATTQELPGGPILVQMAQIAVGPGGVVHFVYWAVHQGGDGSGIYHKLSRDGGRTWEGPNTVDAVFVPLFDLGIVRKYRNVGLHALAVDHRTGAAYVVYSAREPDDADILVTVSHDEGRTWRAPVRVNDDSILPGGESGTGEGWPTNDQWMAAVAIGNDSVLHATWLDYRGDPTGQRAEVYYAHSRDEGRTWSPNARVSDVSFDGTGGYHQEGGGTIGDYMGLAASPLAVHPFWADTRHGRNDVFAATILAGS